jgi:hypothetical protein
MYIYTMDILPTNYWELDESHSINDPSDRFFFTRWKLVLSYTVAYSKCGIMWIDCLPLNQKMSFSLFWIVSLLEGWIVEYNRLWGMTRYDLHRTKSNVQNGEYHLQHKCRVEPAKYAGSQWGVTCVFCWVNGFHLVLSILRGRINFPPCHRWEGCHIDPNWLVVSTPLKNISQLGWLLPIYGKIKNVPNHHPAIVSFSFLFRIEHVTSNQRTIYKINDCNP